MPMSYKTVDPSTGKLIEQFPMLDQAGMVAKLEKSQEAFLEWKSWPLKRRALIFRRLADDLTKNAQTYAQVMAIEMGKPLAEGEAEAKKCAWVCQYYADNAETFLAPKIRPTDAVRSLVRYDPLGIIVAISPWNFPFWQVFRVAAPTLMAGNVIALKHAANTPKCALTIEHMFLASGAPEGLLVSLFVRHEDVEGIIADSRVRGVTLTGSSVAGMHVAALASKNLKPCVMELGGSDPFIVFEDADIQTAADTGALSRCINSGQSCNNAKRFLIHRTILEPFTTSFLNAMQSRVIGPLATHQQRETVHAQVIDALDKGAVALCGGGLPKAPGFFYPPTVLTNINATMRLWHEEVFGPVAALIPFETDDEALALANGSAFGLSAGMWTHNAKRIERFCEDLECGAVFINDLVKSDPRLPFGGVKESGFGRELGEEGMFSFVNIKTIWQR